MSRSSARFVLSAALGWCLCLSTAAPSRAEGPFQYFTVNPCRIVDTRDPGGEAPLAHDTTRDFTIQGICGVPATARAVAINVTVVQPNAGVGFLTVFPAGVARPLASTVNWDGGESGVANAAIVGLSASGQLSIYTFFNAGAGNSTDLVLDVSDYFAAPAAAQ